MKGKCENCLYAEREWVSTDRGGYEALCGCRNEAVEEYDAEIGDTIPCEHWKEEK